MTTFPSNFRWGVASSSYQIEGSPKADQRSPSIWDTFSHTPGNVFDNHTGDLACQSYLNPELDAQLVSNLGAKAYRFSISWPRVIPTGDGDINPKGLDYYERLCDLLLDRGVEPWVTLYHWDLPQSLQDQGGWLNPQIPEWFERYTHAVSERLADRAKGYFTLNEPQIFLGLGLHTAEHAPGLKLSRKETLQATHHALLAHGRAVKVLRTQAPKALVGWVPVAPCTSPASDSPADIQAARSHTMQIRDDENWWYNNTWYADPICLGHYPEDGLRIFADDAPTINPGDMETIHQPIDFYGFNLYTGSVCHADDHGNPVLHKHADGAPVTMFRWPVRPEALRWAARFLHDRYKLPIYVGENGLASMDWVHADGKVHDAARIDYLTRYLAELRTACNQGVDIRGYFQWSILDNFEWAKGYQLRFGLTYVDFETNERIEKDSYHFYRKLIESNGSILPEHIAPIR